jgi:uncharacterized protein
MTADGRRTHPVDTGGDPLIFALAGLMGEDSGTVREYAIDDVEVDPGDGIRLTQPVAGRLRISRTNRGLLVDARLTTAIAGECARCLRPLVTPVKLRINEEVLPSIDISSGVTVEPEEGGDLEAPRLNDHHELDLRPLVIEAINIAEPIAPLCEPDCPGLCPECGERLEPGHAHDDAEIDPRLEVLRAFRVDAGDDSG